MVPPGCPAAGASSASRGTALRSRCCAQADAEYQGLRQLPVRGKPLYDAERDLYAGDQRRDGAGRGPERRLCVADQSGRPAAHVKVDRRQPQRPDAESPARQRHRQWPALRRRCLLNCWFDIKTGEPRGSVDVPDATRFNDIEVAADGTIYATQTGDQNADTWKVFKVMPDSPACLCSPAARPLAAERHRARREGQHRRRQHRHQRRPLLQPGGQLVSTEQAVDPGNDGLVVLTVPRIREQRAPGHGVAHPARAESGNRRLRHPERGVDDLRLEAESPGHPDERLERDCDCRPERAGALAIRFGAHQSTESTEAAAQHGVTKARRRARPRGKPRRKQRRESP